MSTPRTSAFVRNLRASRLLEGDKLREVEARAHRAETDGVSDRALARELVADGVLTKFQAQQLLAGRTQGFRIGPYTVTDRIGSGGMGKVFKAVHQHMQRTVALKVLPKSRRSDPQAQARFMREVRATAQLNHPNIVIAHDVGEEGDVTYLVMEYVEGTDLYRLIKDQGRIEPAQAADITYQVASALEHARRQGIVHRDIKPTNILVTPSGSVKVLDMGLARMERGEVDAEASATLTSEGVVMGTLDYIAPEQARDTHRADIRSDIYSLGCTLYHMLSGRVPFPGGSATDKLARHLTEAPPELGELADDVPPELVAVVSRMMAKNPDDRYQTPAEAATAVLPWLAPSGVVPGSGIRPRQTDVVPVPPAAPRSGPTTSANAETETVVPEPDVATQRARRVPVWAWVVGGATLLVLGAVLLLVWPRHADPPDRATPSAPSPSVPPEIAELYDRVNQAWASGKMEALAQTVVSQDAAAIVTLQNGRLVAMDPAKFAENMKAFRPDQAGFVSHRVADVRAVQLDKLAVCLSRAHDELRDGRRQATERFQILHRSGSDWRMVFTMPSIVRLSPGVPVTRVVPGSQASKTGVRPDDVITRYADVPVHTVNQLIDLVKAHGEDKQVSLVLERDGERLTFDLEGGTIGVIPGIDLAPDPGAVSRGPQADQAKAAVEQAVGAANRRDGARVAAMLLPQAFVHVEPGPKGWRVLDRETLLAELAKAKDGVGVWTPVPQKMRIAVLDGLALVDATYTVRLKQGALAEVGGLHVLVRTGLGWRIVMNVMDPMHLIRLRCPGGSAPTPTPPTPPQKDRPVLTNQVHPSDRAIAERYDRLNAFWAKGDTAGLADDLCTDGAVVLMPTDSQLRVLDRKTNADQLAALDLGTHGWSMVVTRLHVARFGDLAICRSVARVRDVRQRRAWTTDYCQIRRKEAAGWQLVFSMPSVAETQVRVTRSGSGRRIPRSGVRVGDVVVSFAGRPIGTTGQLTADADAQPRRKFVEVVVRRGAREYVSRLRAGLRGQDMADYLVPLSDAQTTGAAVDAIRAAVRSVESAVRRRDREAMRRAYSTRALVMVFPKDGRTEVLGRDKFMELMREPWTKDDGIAYDTYRLADVRVAQQGDVALVYANRSVRKRTGEVLPVRQLFAMVREGGVWRIVLDMHTPVPMWSAPQTPGTPAKRDDAPPAQDAPSPRLGGVPAGNPYRESRGADMPVALHDFACSDVIDGKCYVFGGDRANDRMVDTIYVYDTVKDAWRKAKGKMPYAYAGGAPNSTTTWAGMVYISPGLGPRRHNGRGRHQKAIRFDPATETAEERASFGAAVWSVSPVATGKHIYWFGACGSGQEHKIWRYDPAREEMDVAGRLEGRGRAVSAVLGRDGKVYLFGGNHEERDIAVYDPRTGQCTPCPASLPKSAAMPHAWPGPGLAVYLIRPMHNPSLWVYHVAPGKVMDLRTTYSFTRTCDGPAHAYDPATGKVYFFGGRERGVWEKPLAHTYILTPVR